MNPGRIIWPLMCLVALSTAAQDASTVPEYMKDLESAKTDHARATALFQLAFNISHENTNQGIKWGYEGLGYARLAGDLKLQGDCHNSIGYCFDTSGQPDSALYHYQRSIEFLNSSGNQCATASVFANIGSMHKRRNDLVSALSSFLKALEIQQGGCEDLGYHGSTYYSIGTCYNAMDNYESALKYFEEAAKIEFARGNHAKMGMVHNGMANAYKGLGQWQKAADEFTMAIADYTISNNEYSLAYAYEGKAELFAEQNQLDSAIFYCSQARAIFLAQKVNFDIVYETTLLASYLERKGDKAGAEKLLLEALPISEAEGLDQDRQGIMASLARIAREKGNFELAYKYLSMSTQLRDSLKMDEQKAELAELAAKYETEKRDKLLAIKESENEKQRQQKYFFLAGAVLFLLLALVLVTRYRQKQRMTKTLQEKNVAIEKAKKRAEESEAVKQQFLANMSHEIRTPMNAVVGLSRLLLDKPHDSETREYLEAIHHSGNNLLVILNDILDLSKLEAGKFTIHNISFNLSGELEVLKRVFGPKAEAKGIAFTMHIDQKIPSWISGDPARLLQVLNNLVSNAIKFTSSGSVTLAVLQRNDKIEFEVRDTGMGIPESQQQAIFESFIQANNDDARKYGGTGLGLTIARSLVELMGGNLNLKSAPGQGATFFFSIPLIEAEQPATTSTTQVLPDTGKVHVLVAEDNEYNFLVTRDTLKKYFPEVAIVHAKNGAEAVDACAEDDYDFVLMDVHMPVMDGYAATKKLRSDGNSVPIIGLTASVVRSDLDLCLQCGMNAFVPKPFTDAEFLSALQPFLPNQVRGVKAGSGDVHAEEARFLTYMPDKLTALQRAIDKRDFQQTKSVVHTIRPQLVAMGLQQEDQWCRQLELSTQPGDTFFRMGESLAENISRTILALRQKHNA